MRRVTLACVLASAAAASPDREKEIDEYLSRCERFGFSGSVLVARDGEIVLHRGYGLADRESGERVTADTVFEIASATKPFTACAVLKLAEMGKLSLDDPIAKHLPGVPEDKRAITIRHLLAHTSGMSRMAGGGGDDLAVAVRGYLSKPLARAPGEAHEYWNGGYALLAAIVERAAGTSYMDFCREHLFRPAALASTGFTGDAGLARQAVGYDGEERVRLAAGHPYSSYGWQYRGMGGIVTSTSDLWRFLKAYDEGRILSEESRRLMESRVTPNYGLGWGMAETRRGTLRIGHGGDVRGFHASVQRFPAERAAIVVLSNVEGIPPWAIGWNVEALLFGEAPPYPMPPAIAPPPDLDPLVGRYAVADGDFVVVERDKGEGLLLGGEGTRACAALLGSAGGDFAAEIRAAEEIVAAVRRGDAKPIGAILMPGIPESWPALLVGTIWPRHVGKWGELEGVRTLGATQIRPGRVQILLELRHQGGAPRLSIILQDGRLNIFDLNGPRFAVALVAQPVGPAEFAGFAWLGQQPPRVRFLPNCLVFGGRGGEVRGRRADDGKPR
jgi:CubicO group peptidase (beta-lactamase class C family)